MDGENARAQMPVTILTDTVKVRDRDGGTIPSGRYVWRGPANVPVFALENSRDITSTHVDVVCETPCEAVVVCERTKSGPGVIPSTNHGFARWRIYGNTLADVGFWYRGIDENNEHGRWDSCSLYGCDIGWVTEGQQSKEHTMAHCRAESCRFAVLASSSFQWFGGCVAVGDVAFTLARAGDPVVIQGVGVEACGRLLETRGATTASQPVLLIGVRYEADQLHADGDAIVFRSAGPLTVTGSRFGGGKQRVPRIALAGVGEQTAVISGNTFGSFGAHRVCPVRATNPTYARVEWGRNTYQRFANDPTNTEGRIEWAQRYFA